jgi:hypothetical protein
LNIIEIDTTNSRQVKQFMALPFRLYAETPQWVPPMEGDVRRIFNRKRHPFYRDGESGFFLALGDAGAVGRLAVLEHKGYNRFNQERTSFFHLFEAENDNEVSRALFEAGFKWARQRGLNKMVGPRGFSVFDGFGMLVRGFEHRPAFGLPYNPPYYQELVEASGFVKQEDTVSGYLDRNMKFPENVRRIAGLLKTRRGFSIIPCRSKGELRKIIPELKRLYNFALVGTQGTVPITDEEVKGLESQLLWFADPSLIKIIKKGDKTVGFLLAYPDISAAVQRTRGRVFPWGWFYLLLELKRTEWININGAGILEGYRGLGGTALLFSEMYKSVMDSRYRFADVVQIGMENENMQREMRGLGIDFYKTHRIYERMI